MVFFTASTLALSGSQHTPRSGILLLQVRDEQPVSPLRPKPAEKRKDSEWTAPINRHLTLANRDGLG